MSKPQNKTKQQKNNKKTKQNKLHVPRGSYIV